MISDLYVEPDKQESILTNVPSAAAAACVRIFHFPQVLFDICWTSPDKVYHRSNCNG